MHSISFSRKIIQQQQFSDIVSIIGNLCDNAIEYLAGIDQNKRRLELTVSGYKGYYYITCKNTILFSILKNNPEMNTTKDDVALHGKGIKILRDIAERYNGELLITEHKEELSLSVIMRNQN